MITPLIFEEIKNIYRWVLKYKWLIKIEDNRIMAITQNGHKYIIIPHKESFK